MTLVKKSMPQRIPQFEILAHNIATINVARRSAVGIVAAASVSSSLGVNSANLNYHSHQSPTTTRGISPQDVWYLRSKTREIRGIEYGVIAFLSVVDHY